MTCLLPGGVLQVFSDQLLLQDVLARSDRAMAVVKDLFGDAPQRQIGNDIACFVQYSFFFFYFTFKASCVVFFIGHPSVTMAPNCDSDTELPVLERPDPPTHLSFLSQSMMDQEVCNFYNSFFPFSTTLKEYES